MTRRMLSIVAVAGAATVMGAAQGQLMLEVGGNCPGEIEGWVTGATPEGRLAFVRSQELGLTIIGPNSECAGLMLDLQRARLWYVRRAEDDGTYHDTVGDFYGRACGQYVQAIDVETCTTSNVAQIPG